MVALSSLGPIPESAWNSLNDLPLTYPRPNSWPTSRGEEDRAATGMERLDCSPDEILNYLWDCWMRSDFSRRSGDMSLVYPQVAEAAIFGNVRGQLLKQKLSQMTFQSQVLMIVGLYCVRINLTQLQEQYETVALLSYLQRQVESRLSHMQFRYGTQPWFQNLKGLSLFRECSYVDNSIVTGVSIRDSTGGMWSRRFLLSTVEEINMRPGQSQYLLGKVYSNFRPNTSVNSPM